MTVAYSRSGNGTAHANGKLNSQAKGHRRPLKPKRGVLSWTMNFIARIATWVAILTILFRCPASLGTCNETSPFICRPYFQVKNAISPHVQPYFAQYVAPYVQAARPYYDTLNNHILTPTRQYATLYGTPLVSRGQNFAQAQWESRGQPQLLRLQTLATTEYDKSIAPRLRKAHELVGPYHELVQNKMVKLYKGYVLPGYEVARPYAVRGYDAAAKFMTTTASPAVHWAWDKTATFFVTAVWPQLRVVYVENVEPQLLRIGERLGRYRINSNSTSKAGSGELSADVAGSTASSSSSFSKPAPQNPSTSSSTTTTEDPYSYATESTSRTTTREDYWNPIQAPPATENENEARKTAREMVAEDLATWQNKFASQAEEGAGAIEDQVDEIARNMISGNAQATGKALLNELEDTISAELTGLRRELQLIVEAGDNDANKKALSAIRAAGVAIKKKAQLIRRWREDYDAELQDAVLNAADVYFRILDETRNLALQNIGMKWAWTDGVTYKDWQTYHELKSTLSTWTEELKQLIVTHPTLLEAQNLAHQIEEDGMTLASTAAQELARLKEVVTWKIQANDATNNFESDVMRHAAEGAQKAPCIGTETVSSAVSKQHEDEELKQDTASDDPLQESQPHTSDMPADNGAIQDSLLLDEGQLAREDADRIPVFIAKPPITISLTKAKSSPMILDEAPPGDVGSCLDADQVLVGEPTDADQKLSTSTEDVQTPAHTASFGAAAQSIADRGPILDDDAEIDSLASITSAAQAAYSSAVALAADQYSSALSVVSAQIQGTSKPVHEQLFSSLSTAYGGAVSSASQKLNEVVAAASSGVFNAAPSPTKTSNLPGWDRVESIAAQKLYEGRLWAEIQYQSLLFALGATTATPTSAPEKYYEQAKYHYYAGLGLAQDRYSSFMAAASSAWSSATATPTPTDFAGSASSMASVASKSAASAASAADDAVKSAFTAASEGVLSVAQDAQDTLEKAADAAAEQVVNVAGAVAGTWENVVSRISSDIYGQPSAIGWYEGATQTAGSVVAAATGAVADSAHSASDAAAKQFDAINQIISELIVGKEPTFSESIMSRLSAAYSTAMFTASSLASEASVAAVSVGDKVGTATSQATETVKESNTQKIRDEL